MVSQVAMVHKNHICSQNIILIFLLWLRLILFIWIEHVKISIFLSKKKKKHTTVQNEKTIILFPIKKRKRVEEERNKQRNETRIYYALCVPSLACFGLYI